MNEVRAAGARRTVLAMIFRHGRNAFMFPASCVFMIGELASACLTSERLHAQKPLSITHA